MMPKEPNKERIQEILKSYYEVVSTTKRALSAAGVPSKLHFFYIFIPPKLDSMTPEDVVEFYRAIQTEVIRYLWQIGFSQREIARRLRGGSYAIVAAALKPFKSSQDEDDTNEDNGEDPEGEHESEV